MKGADREGEEVVVRTVEEVVGDGMSCLDCSVEVGAAGSEVCSP